MPELTAMTWNNFWEAQSIRTLNSDLLHGCQVFGDKGATVNINSAQRSQGKDSRKAEGPRETQHQPRGQPKMRFHNQFY